MKSFFPGRVDAEDVDEFGAGYWRAGRFVTFLVDMILGLDIFVTKLCAKLSLPLPGLSYWILCRKN